MCGIIGYTGTRPAIPIIIDGLKKLEYRGYDSAGAALQDKETISVLKAAGSVANLEALFEAQRSDLVAGIGHTRWATHGRPTDLNAHPHNSCDNKIAIIHNGIIENYSSLRSWLKEEKGHRFLSETDSEVLAHLIEEFYEGDLLQAVQKAVSRVVGSYGLVAICAGEPGRIVCARKDSPLVIGLGDGENYVASDIPALLPHTRDTVMLEDGDFASINPSGVEIFNADGDPVKRALFKVTWDLGAAEKGGYDHFMLKEIMEQPSAVRETLRQRIDSSRGRIDLGEIGFSGQELKALKKIYIVACGTAYHAALVGKTVIERLTGLPVEVDFASEFRYRQPLMEKDQLVIAISQSGETADTLAGLRLARSRGLPTLAITNVVGSSVSREADRVFYTWAGPEIAVASTKAYLTQLIALYLFALYLAQERGSAAGNDNEENIKTLLSLPAKLNEILAPKRVDLLRAYCSHLATWESAFFVGRGIDYPVAMEGALKLKEISYIHAEAYAAGELKHGPLALIVEQIPVIAICTQAAVLEKTLSNIQEVKARGGAVFSITREDFVDLAKDERSSFLLPPVADLFTPVLSAVPTQLIAYFAAVARGSSIDKPRNLAKSVTVE